MATPRVRPAGLKSCCLLTVQTIIKPQAGDTVVCADHQGLGRAPTMVFYEGAWERQRPAPRPRQQPKKRRDVAVAGSETRDMVITIHAQERMEERWPDLVQELDDEELGRLIQGEVNDALVAGRHGIYCPIELANKSVERWRAKRGGWYCWNKEKTRGYVCHESKAEGIVVLTTLIGDTKEKAQRKLRRPPDR